MRYIDFKRKYFSYQILLWILLYKIDSKVITDDEVNMFSRESFPFTIDDFTEFINYLVIDNLPPNPMSIDDTTVFMESLKIDNLEPTSLVLKGIDEFVNDLSFTSLSPIHLNLKTQNEFINFFKVEDLGAKNFGFYKILKFISNVYFNKAQSNSFDLNELLQFKDDLKFSSGESRLISFFGSLILEDLASFNASSSVALNLERIDLLLKDNSLLEVGISKHLKMYLYTMMGINAKTDYVPSVAYSYKNFLAIIKEDVDLKVPNSRSLDLDENLILDINNIDLKARDSRSLHFDNLLAKEYGVFNFEQADSASFIIKDTLNEYVIKPNIKNVRSLVFDIKDKNKLHINAYLNKNMTNHINADMKAKISHAMFMELAIEFIGIDETIKIKDSVKMNLMKLAKLMDFDNETLFNLDNQSLSNLDIIII